MKSAKIAFALCLALCSIRCLAVTVTTAADLATALATSPNTVTLGADIDLAGWTTVDGFSGTLDGKGYKITNLDAPLFGTITGDIAISNLFVKGANVVLPSGGNRGMLINSVTAANLAVESVTFTGSTLRNAQKQGNVGFVVGTFSVTGTASFKDCHVDDTCSFGIGVALHGGIVGNGTATGTDATISLTHCTMAAAISTAETYGSQFGGIAGNLSVNGGGGPVANYAHLIMYGCTNYSGVATSWAGSNRGFGGLVYAASGGPSTQMADAVIRDCANYGAYIYNGGLTTGTNYGGLLGGWSNGKLTMEDCVNYGTVTSTGDGDTRSEIGGLLGFIAAPIQVEVSLVGCANTGDITGYTAGGLVGRLSHNASYLNTTIFIRSCMNTGTVTARKEGAAPGEAIGALTSGMAYPRIDIEGGLYATNALIGTYAESATVTVFNTNDNVFPRNSDGLVDGTDLATLNGYDNCGLWKQGHEYPILKILPDEAAPDTVTVTFKDWDDSIVTQKTIASGWYVIPPGDPVRDGWTFIGWSPDVFSGLTDDTTFTAQYSSGVLSYVVSFVDWDGAPLCDDQEVAHGEAATPPANPSRDGYVFSGWSVPFDNVTERLVVQAQYVPNAVYVDSAAALADKLTAGTLPGVTVILATDIELPADWTTPDFRAAFDGAGHTISCPNGGLPLFNHLYGCASNFVIDAASEGSATTISPANNTSFGSVARMVVGGAIRDIAVKSLVVNTGDGCKVGLVAGVMEDGARIEGCTIADSCMIRAKNNSAIGGVAGTIERTDDFAPVDGEGHPVVGETLAVIFGCTNNAPFVVSAGSVSSGGIVGNADNMYNNIYLPSVFILRCENNGSFSATANTGAQGSTTIGGIVGRRSYNSSANGGVLHVVECANNADLASPGTGNASIGGIIGYFWRSCETVFDRCVNRGAIGTAVAGDGETPATGNRAGGLVGYVGELYRDNPITATNCANYGTVTAGTAGGLAGAAGANGGHPNSKLMFYNCANYGTLVGVDAGSSTGEIFARFETLVADSQERQYGAVNCFFMTKNFYADNSGSAVITNGLVTAVDEGYKASGAKRTLNIAVRENGYEPWVLGRIGEGNAAFVAPELACFMKRAPRFTVIIR